ncbi:MAG: hypothetical protein H8E66_12840 [Planctomycetes bacterium]|nr:hypothetical protein [Planctomycetota bacterium]
MNSKEQPMDERQAFDELLAGDRFDDSICDQHQSDLRSKALQAFDDTSTVELRVASTNERRRARLKRSLGYEMTAVVCLIGLVAGWFYYDRIREERPIVVNPPVPDVTITEDVQLLASLTEVNTFRDEVSAEALFSAIAMCELDHEGRVLFD